MSLSQPKPPDAGLTSQIQSGYNTGAAGTQQQYNEINQQTPFSSLTYSGAPGSQTATQTLTPEVQALLSQYQGTQGQLGGIASGLASGIPGMFASLNSSVSNAPNLDPSALTNKVMGWGQSYLQPIFDQQKSNLDSQLASQGITQGSTAYDNAQNLQSRNTNDAYTNLEMQAEPQAFSQAVQSYQLPIQSELSALGAELPGMAGLFGASAPQTSPGFVNTPTTQIQPANYAGLAEQNYGQQNQIYSNTMSGLSNVASAALAAGLAPMTGGLSLAALPGMAAMFGGMGNMPATGMFSPNDTASNAYAQSQGINPYG